MRARKHGGDPAARRGWGRERVARAAAARVRGAASRLLGDEEAEAEVSAVAESNGAGDWLREY